MTTFHDEVCHPHNVTLCMQLMHGLNRGRFPSQTLAWIAGRCRSTRDGHPQAAPPGSAWLC